MFWRIANDDSKYHYTGARILYSGVYANDVHERRIARSLDVGSIYLVCAG